MNDEIATVDAKGRNPELRNFVITDVRATTVTVPLEAPLRHAAGAHWGRFVRTIGLFPNGSRLRLADGCEAMVLAQTGCPERPVVTLLSGPGDTPVPAGRPDRFTIGDLIEGVPSRIQEVSTDDRCITIPELDVPDDVPEVPPSHACWSPHPHGGGTEH